MKKATEIKKSIFEQKISFPNHHKNGDLIQALEVIQSLRDKFQDEKSDNDAFIGIDNNELHDLLNDKNVGFEEINGQDTWIFSDGSYITRNIDEYWTGKDVDTIISLN